MSNFFASLMTATWISVAIWAFWPIEPPITYESGGVIPSTVQQGGVITVSRGMRTIRSEQVTVTRTLVRGDCAKSCEVVDLPSSTVQTAPNGHRVQVRDFTLPPTVEPGEWRVVFRYQWRNRVGMLQSEPIPEIPFTVVK